MPPPPKRTNSNLVVALKYEGLKATQFFSKWTQASYIMFKQDMTTLGMPLPKKANIVFVSHGTLEFFWPIVHNEHTLLTTMIWTKSQLYKESNLSIASMVVHEERHYPQPTNQPPPVATKPPAVVKQKPPHSVQGPKTTSNTSDRYHPYLQSASAASKSAVQTAPRTFPSSLPQKPVVKAEPVDGGLPAPRPAAKQEVPSPSVEPSNWRQVPSIVTSRPHPTQALPSPVPSRPTSAQLPPPPPSSIPTPTHIAQHPNASVPQQSTAPPKLNVITGPVPSQLPPPPTRSVPTSTQLQPPTLVQPQPPSATSAVLPPTIMTLDQAAADVVETLAKRVSNRNNISPVQRFKLELAAIRSIIAAAVDKETCIYQQYGRQNPSFDASASQSAALLQKRFKDTQTELETTKQKYESAKKKIFECTFDAKMSLEKVERDLEERKEKMDRDMEERKTKYDVRETFLNKSLEQAKRSLEVDRTNYTSDILSWQTRFTNVEVQLESEKIGHQNDVTALQKRLEDLERQMKTEREVHQNELSAIKPRFEAMQREMEIEKTKRVEMEHAIKDMERECREPFIVPALLQSFIQLSKATTRAQVISDSNSHSDPNSDLTNSNSMG